MQLKKYQKVEISWIDSCHSGGWKNDSKHKGDESALDCKTIGYCIGKRKRTIQVVQSINTDTFSDGTKSVDSMIQIPKVAINKIKLLK